MKYLSKSISYNCIPICIIFILAIFFTTSLSSNNNTLIEGNTDTRTTDTTTTDIYQNLLHNQQETENRQRLIAERNTLFPEELDTETTNARLDYTTLDVKSINIQLVILSILVVITSIILIITLYQ